MVYRSWGEKSFFLIRTCLAGWNWTQNLGFGFFLHFLYFFLVPTNLIFIGNAVNNYSYLKSTHKELSYSTQMLKREYCLARWNCDENHTLSQKNIPLLWKWPKFTKKCKMAKNHFLGVQNGSKSVFPKWFQKCLNGGFRGVFLLKSGLRILIQAPKVPFLIPPKRPK